MGLLLIKQAMRRLSRAQLKRLDEFLHELMQKADETTRVEAMASDYQIIEERDVENITYRLEGTRCGKEKCKCAQGKLHGPYWYSYMRIEGRVKSKYVGKTLPRAVERSLQLRNENRVLKINSS